MTAHSHNFGFSDTRLQQVLRTRMHLSASRTSDSQPVRPRPAHAKLRKLAVPREPHLRAERRREVRPQRVLRVRGGAAGDLDGLQLRAARGGALELRPGRVPGAERLLAPDADADAAHAGRQGAEDVGGGEVEVELRCVLGWEDGREVRERTNGRFCAVDVDCL